MKKSDDSCWKYFFKTILLPNFLLVMMLAVMGIIYFYFLETKCVNDCVEKGENKHSCMEFCD
ncbi:MAG: hypothetical protein NC218_11030 [Acetobacter sp.]|nr:hypothetical protein [Acetobacter sp.]